MVRRRILERRRRTWKERMRRSWERKMLMVKRMKRMQRAMRREMKVKRRRMAGKRKRMMHNVCTSSDLDYSCQSHSGPAMRRGTGGAYKTEGMWYARVTGCPWSLGEPILSISKPQTRSQTVFHHSSDSSSV